MQTNVAVAYKAGKPLEIETVNLDGPKAGKVLVEIKATEVCHDDEFTLSGADSEGLFPAILCHERAGVSALPDARVLLESGSKHSRILENRFLLYLVERFKTDNRKYRNFESQHRILDRSYDKGISRNQQLK